MQMARKEFNMHAGIGMYSIGEASRLTGIPSRELNRWLFGHSYSTVRGGERVRQYSAPLWKTQIDPAAFDEKLIGFHDLLEVRFVKAFVQHGISLLVVRRCLESAQQVYGQRYPFTTLRFKTDGKTIFGEAVRQAEKDAPMIDLRNKQHVFKEIITPSLYAGIEYDGMIASKWYPIHKNAKIVLDPAKSFGRPIIEPTGTPTDVLFASYLAEGRDKRALEITSAVFDVPVKLLKSAIAFEESISSKPH